MKTDDKKINYMLKTDIRHQAGSKADRDENISKAHQENTHVVDTVMNQENIQLDNSIMLIKALKKQKPMREKAYTGQA